MKPIQLRIKGLNSFIEEQTIDFCRLAELGLFGIFGPTGSGKSTVLDAITLALYGKVPRSGGKPSGIVNTQSDKIQVAYEFAIGEGSLRKSYSVQRSFKRTGSDGARAEIAIIYDISNPLQPVPLCQGTREVNQGILEIIGLSAEDFTRSVVLPQGSFSEFLQLSGSDRRNMLERIFGMEKYGDRIVQLLKSYKGKVEKERDKLNTLVSAYQDLSAEASTSLKEDCKRLQEEKAQLSELWQGVEKEFKHFGLVWALQQEIQTYQQLAGELVQEKELLAERERVLQKAGQATVIKPLIDKTKRQRDELAKKKLALKLAQEKMEVLAGKLELTRDSWEEAGLRKNEQLPQLITRKANLELALRVWGQIQELQEESQRLEQEYANLRASFKQRAGELKNTQEKLELTNRLQEEQNLRIGALKLPPEYREGVNEGFEWEKNCHDLEARCQEMENNIATLTSGLQENELKLSRITEQRGESEKKYQQKLEHKDFLASSCPGRNEDLLSKQNTLKDLENEIKELKLGSQRLSGAESKLNQLREKTLTLEQTLTLDEKVLNEIRLRHSNLVLSLERERDQHMAATLALKLSVGEACPVCGSQHHPMLALDSSSGAINGFGKELDLVTKELGEAEKAVHRLQMEDSYQSQELLHWENEHHSLQEQWAGRNIIKSEEEYRCLQKELDDLKNAIASWEAETSTNEAELSSTQELWAKLKNVEISQATALEKDRQSLDSLKQAGDALQVQREKAAEKYEHFKTVLGLDNIEYKLQEIRVNDREMEALEGKILKTVAKIKRLEEQKISIQEEVQGLQIKLVQFEYSLKDKKQDIGQKNDEMKLLCQDQEPIAGLAALQIEMTKLEKDYEMLSVSYEQEKEQYNELTQQCSGLSASKQALETQLQEQEVELDEQMSAREFVNWKEVLECFMTEDEQESQRLAIQRYREQLSLNAANLERVYVLLQGEYIEEEAWIFLQQRRSQLNQDLEECSKQLLLQEERKIVMEKRMEELTLLQGQKLEVDGQYELLEELENLFKGKKFIDFIARSRLSYMAREASKTLHDISRGRYALELNSDGEFIMRDDYNGGARRPTHTLSGGETFLTSLSLALALSSHIQLGKASLEFFFLDEGFGTLDAEVLEIVIAALEKLHSEKLSVGIISHVEELKHRIPRKLIVSPAQPGISGTTLSIEES